MYGRPPRRAGERVRGAAPPGRGAPPGRVPGCGGLAGGGAAVVPRLSIAAVAATQAPVAASRWSAIPVGAFGSRHDWKSRPGGTSSDVCDIDSATYAAYQQSGGLAPLEGVDTSAYQSSLADAYATDGTQYALPSSFSNVVLFYNTDLFDAAGL